LLRLLLKREFLSFIQKWRIKLDLENEKVIIDKRMARLLLA